MHHREAADSSRTISTFLVWDRHIKEWCQKNFQFFNLCSSLMSDVNALYAFLVLFVIFGRIPQSMFAPWVMLCTFVCCGCNSNWHGSGAHCPHEGPRYQATPGGREGQQVRLLHTNYINTIPELNFQFVILHEGSLPAAVGQSCLHCLGPL